MPTNDTWKRSPATFFSKQKASATNGKSWILALNSVEQKFVQRLLRARHRARPCDYKVESDFLLGLHEEQSNRLIWIPRTTPLQTVPSVSSLPESFSISACPCVEDKSFMVNRNLELTYSRWGGTSILLAADSMTWGSLSPPGGSILCFYRKVFSERLGLLLPRYQRKTGNVWPWSQRKPVAAIRINLRHLCFLINEDQNDLIILPCACITLSSIWNS